MISRQPCLCIDLLIIGELRSLRCDMIISPVEIAFLNGYLIVLQNFAATKRYIYYLS